MNCPICREISISEFVDGVEYGFCGQCEHWWLLPEFRLSPEQERSRYLLHEYIDSDEGYRKFVTPLMQWVDRHIEKGELGLDYGCGRVPVLKNWLSEMGYEMRAYDPFFAKDSSCLALKYRFIVCCEVVEHAYDPLLLFKELHSHLIPGGSLVVQTHFWNNAIDFSSWYYRRDPTHVSFYSQTAMNKIAELAGFTTFKQYTERFGVLSKSVSK